MSLEPSGNCGSFFFWLREAFKKKTGYFMTSSKIHLLPTPPT